MNGPRSDQPSRRLALAATRRQVMQAFAGGLLASAVVRTGGRAATVADGNRYWDYGAAVPILAESYEDVLLANGTVFFGRSSGDGSGIPAEVDALFDGAAPPRQVRFDWAVAADQLRSAYLYQIQFADADGATVGYESLLATIRRSDAQDVTKKIKGLDDASAFRLGFAASTGQEISRISAVGRYDDTVIFLIDDRYGGRTNEVGSGRTAFAALAEGYKLARSGEQLPPHSPLVPAIPIVDGVNQIGYYPGYVGGVAIPRQGVDMAGVERSNPGVQDAIFGNFALTVESDRYAVFFAIRRFVDEAAQSSYFENVGAIYEESGQGLGIHWVKDDVAGETASAVRAFPSRQDASELVFAGWIAAAKLLGVDVVLYMEDNFVVDIGLFLLFTGVVDALPDDPDDWPDHDQRRETTRRMTRAAAGRLSTAQTGPTLYLPDGTLLSEYFEEVEDQDD